MKFETLTNDNFLLSHVHIIAMNKISI